MKQLAWGLAVLGLLFGWLGQAAASFQIVTDQASFMSNDSVGWVRSSGASNTYSTPGGGTFEWSFSTISAPYYNSVVRTLAGGLFVGVDDESHTGAASYVVDANFDFGGRPVTGVGFNFAVAPGTHLTVHDVLGKSQTFTIGATKGTSFVGVTSDVSITGFQLSESGVNFATLQVLPVQFDVAPAPPTWLLAGVGILCVGGYAWQRRKRQQAVPDAPAAR